jgi:hypothetical protein
MGFNFQGREWREHTNGERTDRKCRRAPRPRSLLGESESVFNTPYGGHPCRTVPVAIKRHKREPHNQQGICLLSTPHKRQGKVIVRSAALTARHALVFITV